MDRSKLAGFLALLGQQIEAGDSAALRNLHAQMTEEALAQKDAVTVQIAVIAYSISKFLEKGHVTGSPQWPKFRDKFAKLVAAALEQSRRGNAKGVATALSSAVSLAEKASEQLGRFQQSVVAKGAIKLGADAYAHGASLGAAAELSGAQKGELLKYIGATTLGEKYVSMGGRQRLLLAKKALGMQ